MSSDNEKLFEKPPETITINEVAFMYQILQACAQRGAFKPDEFEDVGGLNKKLKSIIDYANFLEEKKNEEKDQNKTEQESTTQENQPDSKTSKKQTKKKI